MDAALVALLVVGVVAVMVLISPHIIKGDR